jgi:hypothetical protein
MDLPRRIASTETVRPGEAYLTDTPVLRSHAGTQPDLFLRWNAIPPAAQNVDVVVHLHGFSQRGRDMPLAEKVARSGLDLSRRVRPTLALVPRPNPTRPRRYAVPALRTGGLDAPVAYGIERFRPGLAVDRLILSGHSGGVMPALDIIAAAAGAPDELHLFDGLYGRDPALGEPFRDLATLDGWLGARLAQEPQRPGALRVVYIERQTGEMSRAVAALIDRHLASADPALVAVLSRRYRVERSHVPHGYVAWRCGPDLLAEPGVDFDWAKPI